MANNRIFYAIQGLGMAPANTTVGVTGVHGVQSVGMNTSFNLEQVFQFGQLEIYENVENIPDLELTINKVLDGYQPAYVVATTHAATSPTLAGRSSASTDIYLAIANDTDDFIYGNKQVQVKNKNMFCSSVSYTFPVEGNSTEDTTFVGNERIWENANSFHPGYSQAGANAVDATQFANFGSGWAVTDNLWNTVGSDSPASIVGVSRRENILFEPSGSSTDVNGANTDADCTVLPPDVYGITAAHTNLKTAGTFGAHIQSITVSASLGRTPLNELGRRAPYIRYLEFPSEVTCAVEVISQSGDLVSATESGIFGTGAGFCVDKTNLLNRTIRVASCEGTRVFLGRKNKLSSVTYGGGDAGGGNVSVTYNFTTFNDFTVMHSGENNANYLWANRAGFLT